ncbi:MAG: hypothetical protein JSR90_00760 [Proteobacteria bacterium]|nr:hypothetical protein [Pseudomonadota bacterium]
MAIGTGDLSAQQRTPPGRGPDVFSACPEPAIGSQVGVLDGLPLIKGPAGLCFVRPAAGAQASDHHGLCLFQRIARVEAASVAAQGAKLVVEARGTAASAGWTQPTLVERPASSGRRAIVVDFLACPPPTVASSTPTPISAVLRVSPAGDVGRIIVAGERNEIALDVPAGRP